MVCEWGMSTKLGPLTYGRKDEQVFLGRDFAVQKNYSEKTAQDIDEEVRRIVVDNYTRAKEIVEKNVDKLNKIAEALLEFEALDGWEVEQIIKGLPLNKKKAISDSDKDLKSTPAANPDGEGKETVPGIGHPKGALS